MKPSVRKLEIVENGVLNTNGLETDGPTDDELREFLSSHLSILVKLIGKKRSAVRSAV